jgi:hypothetical protein
MRSLLRQFAGRKPHLRAMIVDSRTGQSTPESDARAGYVGGKRRKGLRRCMRRHKIRCLEGVRLVLRGWKLWHLFYNRSKGENAHCQCVG